LYSSHHDLPPRSTLTTQNTRLQLSLRYHTRPSAQVDWVGLWLQGGGAATINTNVDVTSLRQSACNSLTLFHLTDILPPLNKRWQRPVEHNVLDIGTSSHSRLLKVIGNIITKPAEMIVVFSFKVYEMKRHSNAKHYSTSPNEQDTRSIFGMRKLKLKSRWSCKNCPTSCPVVLPQCQRVSDIQTDRQSI